MFDPLSAKAPATNQPYPDSYWASGVTPLQIPLLQQDLETDVAIIGGGYTGLSCAYHLAEKHNIKATVLEGNDLAWGCSGRNAGFVLNGSGRLSFPQMAAKWGLQNAQSMYHEYRSAIDLVAEMIELGNINCDKSPGGYLKVAHKAKLVSGLQSQAEELQRDFGDPVSFVDSAILKAEYLSGTEAHGALFFPYSFGVHPLKLAQGYARMADSAGASLYANTPVNDWQETQGKHTLVTPQGRVTANKVVIASNGYTINRFHSAMDNRHFPVLSSVIVTRPLTESELQACGFKPGIMVMDTRALKYYYRLLPDNRILFGGRGAIRGKDANHPVYTTRLLAALKQSFPQLQQLTVDYSWSGWVSVAFDDYPRICAAENNVFYSAGYCGSGVSFSVQAGKRLAQRVAGENVPDLPWFQSQLPKFPFAPFRRLGLWGFYHWGRFKDHYL